MNDVITMIKSTESVEVRKCNEFEYATIDNLYPEQKYLLLVNLMKAHPLCETQTQLTGVKSRPISSLVSKMYTWTPEQEVPLNLVITSNVQDIAQWKAECDKWEVPALVVKKCSPFKTWKK